MLSTYVQCISLSCCYSQVASAAGMLDPRERLCAKRRYEFRLCEHDREIACEGERREFTQVVW